MVTVSSPPPQLSSSSPAPGGEDADVKRMDDLLEKLKKNMVDLILQGDDVTRQMWHMYSVFEEIFGHPAAATSTGERPLKQVVVGDKIKKASQQKAITSPEKAAPATVATTPPASAATTIVTTASSSFASSTNVVPAVQVSKITSPESSNATPSPQNKVSPGATSPSTTSVVNNRGSPPSSDRPSDTSSAKSEHAVHTRPTSDSSSPSPAVLNATSNPLLDTIGVLATSNADSDDSDLDIVYQQLRYRGRHRRPEQVRVRTHRSTQHRHQHQQQVASSDPESIGYAGSNSIDSGYKSLCATPEVSDSLSSAPEVRRSASDVSASDSSTTSGRPRSLDGQDSKSSKIKMGTRSIAGKTRLPERSSPRHTAIDDVTLDHLMYLRQSLRKDAQRSPSDSIPSSVTSSTYRDSDLSPRNEEWRDQVRSSYPYRGGTSSSSDSTFTGSRASSRGEDIDQEGGGESSSDFLLSGVEYYDLESIQEFPPTTSSYVTMLEEKTRRFQLISASKCPDPLGERHLSSLYRKRSESTQSVNGGGMSRSQHHHQQQSVYSMTSSPIRPPRNSAKALSRHHRQHHATDSKLTEAAIRVLEMIEDFRMGETMSRSGGGRMMPYHEPPPPPPGPSSAPGYPSSAIPRDVYMPRYRKNSGLRTGVRPASTGSLMEHEIDARSVASASSYSASAEHHVCEEIMYDLVCERAAAAAGDRSVVPPPPIPPDRGGRMVRNRLLPVPPQHAASSSSHHQQVYAVDPRRVVVRSSHHKQQRSSNLYSMLSGVHGRGNVDRFLEMEWHLAQERRDNLPPDFPV